MESPRPRIVGWHLAARDDQPCDNCGEPASVIVDDNGHLTELCEEHAPQDATDEIAEVFATALGTAPPS